MAFFKNIFRKKPRRRGRAKSKSRIQEIRSPYAHRKSMANKKLPKKARKTRYSGELRQSYRKGFPVKKWLILIGGTLLVFFLIYTTIFSNFFQLRDWKIYGNNIILDDSKFNEFLQVHNHENLVFINTDEIKETIITQYPEIKELKFKKNFPNTLIMEYENYDEVANLQNYVEETQKKFIINEIGLITQEDFENPNLPFIKIRSDKLFSINNYAISKDKLDYLLDAVYEFEELFGMDVLDAEYKLKEREVHLRTQRGFTIWLDTSLSLQNQFSKLKKALPKLNIHTLSLEYIDLRISSANGERVIFKRK